MSARDVARDLKLSYPHVVNTLAGRCPPSDVLREKLPQLLGVHVNALFTAPSLTTKYGVVGRKPRIEGSWTR